MASRPPDDALARLARWDELRRRANGGRAGAPEPAPAAARPVEPPAAPPPAARPHLAPPSPATQSLPVIEDLIQTLRDLAQRHPSLSLAVMAEDAGVVWHVRATQTAAGVEVKLGAGDAPASSTATRLADLLREHPRLLDDPGR
ncbi:hypothetical protein [Dactylosporangium sp. NPDC051541]|uniref:hypothetical protein n=1 Tax=Dactylosporangium sp. NPDC051541 TaxID=3363977 RepID=UPI0037B5E242